MSSPGRSTSKRFQASHASEKKPTAPAGRGYSEDRSPAARVGMTRLSDLDSVRIVSRDPLSFEPYNVAALRRLVLQVRPHLPEAVLRMVVDAFNEEMMEQFSAFQVWILDENVKNGYVELPDWFMEETEEARKRQGEWIDVHLPERHFTTVVEEDGTEKLVFSLKEKEKAGYQLKSKESSIVMSFSADLEPELRPAFRVLLPKYPGSERYQSPHAVEKKKRMSAAAAVLSDRCYDKEDAPAAREEAMTRLPRMEVARILTRDPSSTAPYNMEAVRKLALQEYPDLPEEVLRIVAEKFNDGAMQDFMVFQNWVRGEFEEKGYVEVPKWFMEETEEVRKQQVGNIDLYLPRRHFTTVVEDDGSEKLVFSFKKKEKSTEGNIFMSFSSSLEPELEAAFSKRTPESSEKEDGDNNKGN